MGAPPQTCTRTGMDARIDPCVKCEGERVSLLYRSPGYLAADGSDTVDYIGITCTRCGYTWDIAPLDRKEE